MMCARSGRAGAGEFDTHHLLRIVAAAAAAVKGGTGLARPAEAAAVVDLALDVGRDAQHVAAGAAPWLGGAPSRLKARRRQARRFRRVPVDAGVHDRVRAEGVALDGSEAAPSHNRRIEPRKQKEQK